MLVEARMKLHKIGSAWLDSSLGRMVITIDGEQKLYYHYVWFLNTGHWPDWVKREVVHHKDRNPLNDDFSNLELMLHSEHASLHFSSGKNHPAWRGDKATAVAKYLRHWKYPDKYPPLTEEEREERNAYSREYKKRTDYNRRRREERKAQRCECD